MLGKLFNGATGQVWTFPALLIDMAKVVLFALCVWLLPHFPPSIALFIPPLNLIAPESFIHSVCVCTGKMRVRNWIMHWKWLECDKMLGLGEFNSWGFCFLLVCYQSTKLPCWIHQLALWLFSSSFMVDVCPLMCAFLTMAVELGDSAPYACPLLHWSGFLLPTWSL